MLKVITELAQILTSKKGRKISGLYKKSFPKTKMELLVTGVQKGKIKSEIDAVKYLYGEDAQPNLSAYSKLKSLLKSRLLDSLIHFELDRESVLPKVRQNALLQRDLAIISFMSAVGARYSAIWLSKKVFEKAKTYELWEIAIKSARILKQYYVILNKRTEFNYYQNQIKTLSPLLLGEIVAENCHQHLFSEIAFAELTKEELNRLANDHIKQLKKYTQRVNSISFNERYIRVKSLKFCIENNLSKAIKELRQLLPLIKNNATLYHPKQEIKIRIELLNLCLEKMDLEGGNEHYGFCVNLLKQGSQNWFVLNGQYFLLLLACNKLIEARDLIITILSNPRYKFISVKEKKEWTLYNAYLQLALDTHHLSYGKLTKFRIGELPSEKVKVSITSKSHSIPLLIWQSVFYIQTQDYKAASEKIKLLQQFKNRIIQRKEDARIRNFIKILMQVDRIYFKLIEENPTLDKYVNELEKSPRLYLQIVGVEILPFERLWEIVKKSISLPK